MTTYTDSTSTYDLARRFCESVGLTGPDALRWKLLVSTEADRLHSVNRDALGAAAQVSREAQRAVDAVASGAPVVTGLSSRVAELPVLLGQRDALRESLQRLAWTLANEALGDDAGTAATDFVHAVLAYAGTDR